MPQKQEGVLVNVASAIGSALGAVAVKAAELKHLAEEREHVVAESLKRKDRRLRRQAGLAKRRLASGKRVSSARNVGKGKRGKAAGRRKS